MITGVNSIYIFIITLIDRLAYGLSDLLYCRVIPHEVEYSGFDVLYFYLTMFRNYFSGYPWQIKVSYAIIIGCIICTLILFLLFWQDVFLHNRDLRREREVFDRFEEGFRSILANDSLSPEEMEEILGMPEADLRKFKPKHFVKLLAQVRMEMYEIVYLPNLQPLANIVGVREHLELNLLKKKDVFLTLQVLLLFQLVISEGRLANYVNSGEHDIRMLARLCYVLCSENEPFRYLVEDLNEPQSLMLPMLLHYVLGWMKEQDRRMPNFIVLADSVQNDQLAAFMLREVAYWGNPEEKNTMSRYFLADRHECRRAAIFVAAQVADEEIEDKMVDSYPQQPEEIRRDILSAVLAIKSGRYLDFLVNVYYNSTTRDTRELALSCIYNYGNEGRRQFEQIRAMSSSNDRTLFDQVDSSNLLVLIRSYS